MSKNRTAYRLTESAVMLAFASVLSVLKIIDMPYGGSVTAFSMLPLLIIAYRYGTRWGLLTAFTYGLIQMLLGMDNLAYATGFVPVVMIILFDYLVAFVVLGLGGIFRRNGLSQGMSLSLAAVFTGLLRYLCHVWTGCTVWAELSVPTTETLVFSLSYNGAYMLPEIIILVLGAVYVSRLLSFEGATISRTATQKAASRAALVASILGKTALLVAGVWIVTLIAPALQATDGTLFLSGLAAVNWAKVGIIAAVGIVAFAAAELSLRRKSHS